MVESEAGQPKLRPIFHSLEAVESDDQSFF
jgi:hypothetical protein